MEESVPDLDSVFLASPETVLPSRERKELGMTERVSTRWALLAVVAAIVAASQVAIADDSPAAAFYYSYFDQPIALDLDAGRIAVTAKPVAQGSERKSLSARLAPFGIGDQQVKAHAVNRLSIADVPQAAREAGRVQQLVANMAASAEFEFVSPVFLDGRGLPLMITRDLLVGFEPGVASNQAELILSTVVDGRIKDRDWTGMPGVYRLVCDSRDGFAVLALANTLAEMPEVRFAEPDMLMTAVADYIPNDPQFGSLWGLRNIGQSGGLYDFDMDASEAWDITTGDAGIIVGIMDDGIQQNHPDINQISGFDFTGQGSGGGPVNDCDHHGTTVAGCVSATIDNGIGVVGVSPVCKTVAAKVTIANVPCDGFATGASSWQVSALHWLTYSVGARVTNYSITSGYSSSVSSKYSATRSAGVIHFSSTGNTGGSGIGFPASLSTVNAVGAADRYGTRASFSTYGSQTAFLAPGQTIRTTDRTGSDGYESGDYTFVDGTSYSSPYAAGVAALILALDDTLTVSQVEQVMEDTCRDMGSSGWDQFNGWGLLNANEALLLASALNDECESATPVANGTYTGTTAYASNDGAATCGSSSSTADIWFAFTPAYDGQLNVDTCGSSFDTVLSVHTDCPGSGANEIGCNEDSDDCGSGSQQSSVSVAVTEGNVYLIRLSGRFGSSGDYVLNVDGPLDDIAPTPDPMTFDLSPTGTGANQIEMSAIEAFDAHSPPVEYQFEFVTGAGGGTDSGWQTTREYTDTGLLINEVYTYKVRARDAVLNTTAYSSEVTAYSGAETPEAPLIGEIGANYFELDVQPAGNPTYTEFAIGCASAADPSWDGKFVDTEGNASETAVWQTDADWGVATALGLTDGVEYCWHVMARNQDGVETDFSEQSCAQTSAESIVIGRSCRTHGSTVYCEELGIGDGVRHTGDNVEWRLGATTELEFDVTGQVPDFSATVSCAVNAAYAPVVTPVYDGSSTIAVQFDPGLPLNDCCTITFSGAVTGERAIATLEGSVDGDLIVNTLDFSAIKARWGQPVDASNYRYDVNTDGVINTIDSSAVKARFGNGMESCP